MIYQNILTLQNVHNHKDSHPDIFPLATKRIASQVKKIGTERKKNEAIHCRS